MARVTKSCCLATSPAVFIGVEICSPKADQRNKERRQATIYRPISKGVTDNASTR